MDLKVKASSTSRIVTRSSYAQTNPVIDESVRFAELTFDGKEISMRNVFDY